MAARTDAEQARRGLEGLREELTTLREYAAAAKAEAAAAKEAAAARAQGRRRARVDELRIELQAALAKLAEFKHRLRGGPPGRRRRPPRRRAGPRRRREGRRGQRGHHGEVHRGLAEDAHHARRPRPAPRRPGSGVRAARPGRGLQAQGGAARAPAARRASTTTRARWPCSTSRASSSSSTRRFAKLVGYQEHEFGKATWPSVLDRQAYKEQQAELDAMVAGDARAGRRSTAPTCTARA